ncbi:MAG: B12-binding domain-containing radical SAM protein [Proteobacteria bacterium]|nr:B12-binding domain-containing radical SAM protein [Pseudomonadota bacterium]
MTMLKHVLLINPTITSRRSARFPLAVLNLSAALAGRYASSIIDGNIDRDFVTTALRTLAGGHVDAVGLSVMGGPQLRSAILVSKAIRARFPGVPIIWGGHFPSICAEPALNEPYVDYAIRGQGEETLVALLDVLFGVSSERLDNIAGLSWRSQERVVHNPGRAFSTAGLGRSLPYDRLTNPRAYLGRTFLGNRTTGFQAALGCRFRCTFCGVASMFRGKTALPPAERLEHELRHLQRHFGADSVQFFDHNFFDREEDTVPLLEVLSRLQLPWWCFARADALLNLSESSWALVRKSRLRMAYIGAESPSDWLLHDVRKGTRTDQTLEAVEICRRNDVIPELSFMLAPPQDPEGETERTFDFIRQVKRLHPKTEIMLYIYAPLPPAPGKPNPQVQKAVSALSDTDGKPLVFPTTADGWAQQKWLSYWCHTDAPWLTPALRERIRDFTTVLGCRFPTITDVRSPSWGKAALQALASWRYRFERYGRPWELNASRKFIRLWDPRVSGL